MKDRCDYFVVMPCINLTGTNAKLSHSQFKTLTEKTKAGLIKIALTHTYIHIIGCFLLVM